MHSWSPRYYASRHKQAHSCAQHAHEACTQPTFSCTPSACVALPPCSLKRQAYFCCKACAYVPECVYMHKLILQMRTCSRAYPWYFVFCRVPSVCPATFERAWAAMVEPACWALCMTLREFTSTSSCRRLWKTWKRPMPVFAGFEGFFTNKHSNSKIQLQPLLLLYLLGVCFCSIRLSSKHQQECKQCRAQHTNRRNTSQLLISSLLTSSLPVDGNLLAQQ